jgi:hypothetical protein
MKKIIAAALVGCFCLLLWGQDASLNAVIKSVYSSSALPDDGAKDFPNNARKIRYAANKIFDSDPATTWAEGAPEAGLNESVSISLEAGSEKRGSDSISLYLLGAMEDLNKGNGPPGLIAGRMAPSK